MLSPGSLCTASDLLGPLSASPDAKVKASDAAQVFSCLERVLLSIAAAEDKAEKDRNAALGVEITREEEDGDTQAKAVKVDFFPFQKFLIAFPRYLFLLQ